MENSPNNQTKPVTPSEPLTTPFKPTTLPEVESPVNPTPTEELMLPEGEPTLALPADDASPTATSPEESLTPESPIEAETEPVASETESMTEETSVSPSPEVESTTDMKASSPDSTRAEVDIVAPLSANDTIPDASQNMFGATSSVPETTAPVPMTPDTPAPKSPLMKRIIMGLIGLVIILVLGFWAYAWGHSTGYTSGQNAQMTASAAAALKIPANATIISQCSPGEGTQYVLPGDIPQGPIYNMWNNKITGIEYMLGQSKIASAMTQDLTLMGQQYNHVDVMYEAAGHAGFTEPHYHVIFSLISYADEQKITCSGSSSSMSTMQ